MHKCKDIIDVYADRKTHRVRTARNVMVQLVFQTGYKKSDKLHNTIFEKYIHATPATSLIARAIATYNEIYNNSVLRIDDLRQNTVFSIAFHGGDINVGYKAQTNIYQMKSKPSRFSSPSHI